jgi:putative redox protein
MKITLNRMNEAVHLEASNTEGNKVQIDGAPKIGGAGKGVRPMELLLMGLGGCSSMDILSILVKQKVVLDDFYIDVEARRDDDNVPSLFTDIHVTFFFKGQDLKASFKKIERAVTLSMDKYCSVTKILEKSAKITHQIVLEG